jgi:NADPH-dependent 2,4-dienoyl-CoA reductase/sulfur reductase-like enzyme
MQIHTFHGPIRIFGFTVHLAGGELSECYAPWTAFKPLELRHDEQEPAVNPSQCPNDIEAYGVHITKCASLNHRKSGSLTHSLCAIEVGAGNVMKHAILVAGAGPTGLMLAGELALAGVDVAIVEPRANQDLAGLRAGGLHSRTIEVLDQRGIADRFLSQGQVAQVAGFSLTP